MKRKPGRPLSSDWIDSNTAARQLGITPRQLRKLRAEGLFKPGTHYRIISRPNAGRPNYRWHVDRCAVALEVPLEERGLGLLAMVLAGDRPAASAPQTPAGEHPP
jgi:predicted ArsR family transcriptional regulator